MNLDDKLELLGDIFSADLPARDDREALFQTIEQAFHCLAEQGEDAEDDKWLVNRDLFLRVVKPLIAELWKRNSRNEHEELPWEDDSLVRAWVEWRPPHSRQLRLSSCAPEAGVK